MLPRIPLTGSIKDFHAFSDAGRELAWASRRATNGTKGRRLGGSAAIRDEHGLFANDLDEDERFQVNARCVLAGTRLGIQQPETNRPSVTTITLQLKGSCR